MGVKVREKPPASGIWWIFIDHQNRRKAKKIGKDRKLAEQVAKKVEARLTLGDMGLLEDEEEKDVPTFKSYADTWIDVTVPATCKPSTAKDYRHFLNNHVLPVLGKMPVTEINKLTIKTLLMDKGKSGLSPSAVNYIKSAVSGVLNLAVDDGVITSNPALRLGKAVKTKTTQEAIDPLTREELSLLLDTIRQQFPKRYPFALTLARTGMRLGEALALQWDDIDFHRGFIKIQRNFHKGKIVTPKNGKSRRVDMSKQLTEVLLDLKRTMKIEAVKNGWGAMPKWVFINGKCGMLDGDNWRKFFYKALEKAGVRRIRIHDIRHTYASLLIQAGESLAYVRNQLGHCSIKVTVDIYGHLVPGANRAAVDRLDDAPDAINRNLSATGNKEGANHVG
jgi:integrase